MQFDPRVEDALARAAAARGVPVDYLRVLAKVESGGNPYAQNPSSSAGGLMQFTDSTAKRYGLSNKLDPYQSADAAARMMRDNMNGLRPILGRDPTAGELYLAHQQGLGGARKLLSNPNAPAVQIVGKQAVTLNAGNPNMTAGQFANQWVSKADGLLGKGAAVSPGMSAVPQAVADNTAGIASVLPGSIGAAGAAPAAAAAPADPMGGIFGLMMQAKMSQPVPAAVGAAPPKPKMIDRRSDDEKLASVSQTPNVYLERLKRKKAYV
jgi:hypothetical protein